MWVGVGVGLRASPSLTLTRSSAVMILKAAVIWFTWERVGRWWGDGGEMVGGGWGGGGRDLVHLGGASDVEEVGGLPAVGRNDVHGRHRQAWLGVGLGLGVRGGRFGVGLGLGLGLG